MASFLTQMNRNKEVITFLNAEPLAHTGESDEKGETIVFENVNIPYYVTDSGIQELAVKIFVTKLDRPMTRARYLVTATSNGDEVFSRYAATLQDLVDSMLSAYSVNDNFPDFTDVKPYLAAKKYRGNNIMYSQALARYMESFEKRVANAFSYVVAIHSENDRIYRLPGVTIKFGENLRPNDEGWTDNDLKFSDIFITDAYTSMNLSFAGDFRGQSVIFTHSMEMTFEALGEYIREEMRYRLDRAFLGDIRF